MSRRGRKEADTRLSQILKASKAFGDFRAASEVLTRVRAVPTRFCQIDHATRVEGWPIERFTLVHGKSNEGKSLFNAGLIDSFLVRDDYALLIDAERTTPITWLETLMGERSHHPAFFAQRPDSYEGVIADVRNFLNTLIKLKSEGALAPETSAIIVVDSLRKLVPKDAMKLILEAAKDGSFNADGEEIKAGKDRSGQIQAKMNAAWMDEVIPMLEKAGAGMVAVAREMQDPDADMWAKKAGNDYKISGGGAIFYDSSLVVRVERDSFVQHGEDKSKKKVYGERHKVTIRKTKIAGKDDKVTVGYFHSSNGTLVPEGFDRARDVLELAGRLGVVQKSGAWYAHGEERIGQGQHNSVVALTDAPEWCARIEAETRARFKTAVPLEDEEPAAKSKELKIDYDPKTGEVFG